LLAKAFCKAGVLFQGGDRRKCQNKNGPFGPVYIEYLLYKMKYPFNVPDVLKEQSGKRGDPRGEHPLLVHHLTAPLPPHIKSQNTFS
jgi:hypothetical protein